MKLPYNKLAAAVRVAFSVGAVVATGSAFAQDAGTQPDTKDASRLETVTVTGSRIRSVDVETSQPVFTITQADIQKTGLINVGDILAHMTLAGAQTFSKAGVLISNAEAGGQYVNIRNLGEQRTLVLVDGKRWATSLAGFTDLSTIPSSLIERIEILKDGASAIYGSDAIAGVVNIILKERYTGVEGSVYYGQNDNGDDDITKQYSLTMGTVGDKSSTVFGASYSKEDPVWARTRNETSYTYGPNHSLSGLSGTGPWGRFRVVDPTTGKQSGSTYRLNHTGCFDGKGVGADSRNIADYHTSAYAGGCDNYDPTLDMNLAGTNEAKSIFSKARYDFNDDVSFKATAMYNERDNTSQVAGYPLNSASQARNPVYIDPLSYYNPLPGQSLFFTRRNIEIPRVTERDVKSFHFDAGFNGGFDLGDHPWNWDVGFNYNKYDVNENGSGNLILPNLKQALGPSFLNAGGGVQCGTAAKPIPLSQCVPYNILGGPSGSTPEALAFVNDISHGVLESLSKEFEANITGTLFTWWGGDVSAAGGFEHRQLSGYFHKDALVASAATTDLAGGNTNGRYSTNEEYVEFNIPLLKDIPGAKLLSLDIAARHSDYSNFGGSTKPKYSFTWKPIEDLLVRGTYAKGFRAPTLSDIAGGGSQSFDFYTDPCDTRFGAAATDAAIEAKCRAAGLPAGFRQLATTGLPITAPETQSTSAFNAGAGNSSLQPELSTSKTAGFVYSPQWVPGLNLSADWYQIKITNTITAISADYVLQQCYVNNSPFYCTQFGRDGGTGAVIGLNRGNTNLGFTSTEGWDFGVSYRLPETSIGQFSTTFDANYMTNYLSQGAPGDAITNAVGQWSYPRVRANLGVDWSLGDFGAHWGVRYYGAFRDECWNNDLADPSNNVECNQPTYNSPSWGFGEGANRVGAIVFHDVQVRYDTPWKGNIQVGVNNVFDKKRPITYSVTNSSATLYDPALDIDRFFYVRYTQKF
jgi:iron complex outermembrane receptor protein